MILAIARAMALGNQTNDIKNPKTQKMGGVIVVKDDSIAFSKAEGSDFKCAGPDEVLNSV